MFLQRFSTRLLLATNVINKCTFCTLNYALGKPETEIIDKWKRKFADENISEIDSSIRHILDHVIERSQPSQTNLKGTDKQITLTDAQLNRFEKLCECRMARMPVQYILGEWDFCDLVLKMVPPVFIPRPETEELVELILQQCDSNLTIRFLEVGCGSGAISLALLHALQKSQCLAIDQSEMACKLTQENAINLGLMDRMKIFRHKLTDDSELPEISGKLDLIVSNPPYILTKDLKALQEEIYLYEDLRALDGGPDGLIIIKSIIKLASKRLCLQGHLWLEVDPTHPPKIKEYIEQHEGELKLKFVASYKDMFGKERFVEVMKN